MVVTGATSASFRLETPPVAGAYLVTVRAHVRDSEGPAGSATANAPPLLVIMITLQASGAAADAAAQAAMRAKPGLGAPELLATLVAAGYPTAAAAAAVRAQLPGADLASIIAALASPAQLAAALSAAQLDITTIAPVVRRIFPGPPVTLAIQLKSSGSGAGPASDGLTAAFPAAPPGDLTRVLQAVFDAPWELGNEFHLGHANTAAVAGSLVSASPRSLWPRPWRA